MKYFVFFLAILHANIVFSGEPDKKLHSDCIYPTLMVTNSRGSQGTGVIIRSDKIKDDLYHNVLLSCKHILPDQSTKLEVHQIIYKDWSKALGTKTYPARIYAQNKIMDLSIILFSSKEQMPVATLNLNPNLYIGNEVYRVGCGHESESRLDYGKITSLSTNVNGIDDLVRTSIYTIKGDSGGPVYENYQVVGVTIAIFMADKDTKEAFNSISYFMPVSKLIEWDKELQGTIGFAYKKEPLPVMDYFLLHLQGCKLSQ